MPVRRLGFLLENRRLLIVTRGPGGALSFFPFDAAVMRMRVIANNGHHVSLEIGLSEEVLKVVSQ